MVEFDKKRTTQGYLDRDKCAAEYLDIYIYNLICVRKLNKDSFSKDDYISFCLTSSMIDDYNAVVLNSDKVICDAINDFKNNNPSLVSSFFSGYGTTFPPKVIIWEQRKHTKYYIEKLQESFLFELYIYTLFLENGMDLNPYLTEEGQNTGENEKGVEIKNDTKYRTTNNVYIEYKEKSNVVNSEFVNSGILKDDNTKFFLIGDKDKFWIFDKQQLVKLFNKEYLKNKKRMTLSQGIRFASNPTSRGMLLSVQIADQLTKTIVDVIQKLS